MVIGISGSFYVVFAQLLAPIPNFNQIGQKTPKLEISVLVGRAGRWKSGCRHFKLVLSCFCSILSPHTKFHPNRTKNTEVRNFYFWSILVGRAGRSHFQHSITIWKFKLNRMKIGRISPFLDFWLVGPVCVGEIYFRIRIQSSTS